MIPSQMPGPLGLLCLQAHCGDAAGDDEGVQGGGGAGQGLGAACAQGAAARPQGRVKSGWGACLYTPLLRVATSTLRPWPTLLSRLRPRGLLLALYRYNLSHPLPPAHVTLSPSPSPNPRQVALDEVKRSAPSEDEQRRVEKEVQRLTDDFVAEVDKLVREKEKSITLHSS